MAGIGPGDRRAGPAHGFGGRRGLPCGWNENRPRALAAAAVCAFAACSSGPGHVGYADVAPIRTGDDGLLTILHLLEAGRRNVARHLDAAGASGAAMRRTIGTATDAVVRVSVRSGFEGSSYSSEQGSGIVIGSGRYALTAGHVVDTLRDAGRVEVVVTTVGGQPLKARAAEWDYARYGGPSRDWAIVELLEPVPAGVPALALAPPTTGADVAILGYPAQVGVRPDGRLAYHLDEAGSALAPLSVLGTVTDAGAVTIAPRIGCIPEGGMSGGPVVDASGHLVAVLVAVVRSADGDGVLYEIAAAPLDRARQWLVDHGGE